MGVYSGRLGVYCGKLGAYCGWLVVCCGTLVGGGIYLLVGWWDEGKG